jgi:hypothetical protein
VGVPVNPLAANVPDAYSANKPSPDESRVSVKTVDLLQLKAWSEHLCRLATTDPRQVVAALGVGSAPATHIRGVGRVDPPPAGTSRCEMGLVDGSFQSLTFTFRTPAIDRASLEDAMGPGTALRRLRPGQAPRVTYRVVVPGAPFSCDVVAVFTEPHADRSLATEIMLRRHRGATA